MATLQQSVYMQNKVLDAVFNGVAFSIGTVYVSLHNGDPGLTGANEITGGSYVRKAGSYTAAAAKAVDSDADLEWLDMPAVGSPGVTHVGYWDAVTGGNYLCGGQIAAAKIVNAGDPFRIYAGSQDISLP